MGYVAVSGGDEAITNAEALLAFYRLKGGSTPVQVRQIREQMRLAVDKVMSEGSLYAPGIAALALKQAEGTGSRPPLSFGHTGQRSRGATSHCLSTPGK